MKFIVKYSGSDIIEANDEEHAIEVCMEQMCIPDLDFNAEEIKEVIDCETNE
jgi:hypothetical protein